MAEFGGPGFLSKAMKPLYFLNLGVKSDNMKALVSLKFNRKMPPEELEIVPVVDTTWNPEWAMLMSYNVATCMSNMLTLQFGILNTICFIGEYQNLTSCDQ